MIAELNEQAKHKAILLGGQCTNHVTSTCNREKQEICEILVRSLKLVSLYKTGVSKRSKYVLRRASQILINLINCFSSKLYHVVQKMFFLSITCAEQVQH